MSIDDAVRRAVNEAVAPVLDELRSVNAALRHAARGKVEREYLDTDEAAELARVRPATIRAWLKQGRLQRYGSGRRLLIRASEIHELLAPESADPIDEAVEAELRSMRVLKGK